MSKQIANAEHELFELLREAGKSSRLPAEAAQAALRRGGDQRASDVLERVLARVEAHKAIKVYNDTFTEEQRERLVTGVSVLPSGVRVGWARERGEG